MPKTVSPAIFRLPADELGMLFKPVQLRVLEKMSKNIELTQNEKRYLRGRLGMKLRLMERLAQADRSHKDALDTVLGQLGVYYITGYEALKHNGFGWYFEPRRMEVMNTRLSGRLDIDGKAVIFHRLKAIGRHWWAADRETGRRYATNERILVDARRLGQGPLVRTWISMLERYKKAFVPNPGDYKELLSALKDFGRPEDYGV
jgi:hypothetical protein